MVKVKPYNLKIQKALKKGDSQSRWIGEHLRRLRSLNIPNNMVLELIKAIGRNVKASSSDVFDGSFRDMQTLEDIAYFMDTPIVRNGRYYYVSYSEIQRIYDSLK